MSSSFRHRRVPVIGWLSAVAILAQQHYQTHTHHTTLSTHSRPRIHTVGSNHHSFGCVYFLVVDNFPVRRLLQQQRQKGRSKKKKKRKAFYLGKKKELSKQIHKPRARSLKSICLPAPWFSFLLLLFRFELIKFHFLVKNFVSKLCLWFFFLVRVIILLLLLFLTRFALILISQHCFDVWCETNTVVVMVRQAEPKEVVG